MPSWRYFEATTTSKIYTVRAMSMDAARTTVPEPVTEVHRIDVPDTVQRALFNAVEPSGQPAVVRVSTH